jgi:prolipoprotein diacylglyceryltransferase
MLALGIFLAALYFIKQFSSKDRETLMNLLAYSILAGLIGARVNYILEHLRDIQTFGYAPRHQACEPAAKCKF